MKDWRERYPTIYAEDQEYWSGRGFEEVESARGEASFRGIVTVRRKGDDGLECHDFELQFDYPPGYPYYPPKVKFISPKIERARHQGTDGAPCSSCLGMAKESGKRDVCGDRAVARLPPR